MRQVAPPSWRRAARRGCGPDRGAVGATSSPSAQRIPGAGGIRTRSMPSSRASAAGVQRPRAAEGHQRVAARIVALAHRDDPDGARACWSARRETMPARRLDDRGAELGGEPRRSPARPARAERHAPVEELRGAQPPEHDVGVGHRRLVAAAPVAGRARLGARALRPDAQRAARVDPGDAAAAGADRLDLELGMRTG